MSTAHRDDDVITLPAAARLLGVGPTTLKRWSDQGRLPHTRTPGGHRRFLKSVVLDFRAVVDPRAGLGGPHQRPSLSLGDPCEWADRAHTLADPDRMEAALLALRAGVGSWGEAADVVLEDFVQALRRRHRDGRLSLGAWRAICRSLVRGLQRVAGRLRPGRSSEVALVASPDAATGGVLVAMAECVLREVGYTVLDVGTIEGAGLLEEVIAEQRPHRIVLAADAWSEPSTLVHRLGGVGRSAARHAADLWLVGGASWPALDGGQPLGSFRALDATARRAGAVDEDVRALP